MNRFFFEKGENNMAYRYVISGKDCVTDELTPALISLRIAEPPSCCAGCVKRYEKRREKEVKRLQAEYKKFLAKSEKKE